MPEPARGRSRSRAADAGAAAVPRGLAAASKPFGALQRAAGNAAVASLLAPGVGARPIQREEEYEKPLEPANTVLDWKDRLEVPHALTEAKELEEAGSAAKAAGTIAEAGPITPWGAANSAVLGPAEMGLGVVDVVSGIQRGGEGGIKQAVGGAAGFAGGAATTFAPVLGAAAAPVALGATAFNAGMALGDAGLKESPYDLPGEAADWGVSTKEYLEDSWVDKIPGASSIAGGAATLAGSIAETPAAAYYGAKSAAKSIGRAGERVGEGIADAAGDAWDWAFGEDVKAEAPVIDLPSTENIDDY